MKVLLYFQDQDRMKKSGIGRALRHQIKALSLNGIEYTLDPKDNFDLAHINTYFGKSQRVLKKVKKKGIPVIVHGHSTFEDFRESFRLWKLIEPYYDRCLIKQYSRADYIITPTPYSKKLIENYDFVKCPVVAISNGIDPMEYAYNEDNVKAFKEYFHLAEGDKVVIGIGWFFYRKGLDDFFKVAKSLPNIKFIWFGHQPKWQTQGRMLKEIKNKPNNVIMPGYIDGKVIKGALSGADMMFFPSREETEGIVVLEAMASRLPLLVRDIPVYDPWLKDRVNCYKGKTTEDFISLIPQIIKEKDEKMLDQALADVKESDLQAIGARLKAIYEQVLLERTHKHE